MPIDIQAIIRKILESLGIPLEQFDQCVTQVKNDPTYYFPVRHHSPNSAWHLQQLLRQKKPKAVFIEGASNCDSLIPFLITKETRPPVAFFSFYRDEKNTFGLNGIRTEEDTVPFRFMVWSPFTAYSPEYVALKTCAQLKIPAFFIDLPLIAMIPYMFHAEISYAEQVKHSKGNTGEMGETDSTSNKNIKEEELSGQNTGIIPTSSSPIQPKKEKKADNGEGKGKYEGYQENEAILNSKFYQKFCEIFGFSSFDEVWDSFFEIGTQNRTLEHYRDSLLQFSAAIRLTLPPEYFKEDGTNAREKYMKHVIRSKCQELKLKPQDIVVVTGGLHSIALPVTEPESVEYSTEGLFESIIPYSYYLISSASGYGAGVPFPRYLSRAWDYMVDNNPRPYSAASLDSIIDAIRRGRQRDAVLSIADSIDSMHSAELLAAMRYRTEPIIYDVIDAIESCCVKGNPLIEGKFFQDIFSDLFVGYQIGKVTEKIGNLPLQADFYQQVTLYKIPMVGENVKVEVNLQEDRGKNQSKFLWQVNFLELEFAECTDGPIIRGDVRKFSEIWSVHWHPKLDGFLIEKNAYGSSVEGACQSVLLERIFKNRQDAEKVARLLYDAVAMDLTKQFSRLYQVCMDALNFDTNVSHLANAFSSVTLLRRQFFVQRLQPSELMFLDTLVNRIYHSFCFALSNANPKGPEEEEFATALQTVLGIVVGFGSTVLDSSVFAGGLTTLGDATSSPYIKGACTGVLHLLGTLPLSAISQRIKNYLRSEMVIKIGVGEFIRGIFRTCEAKVLFEEEIISAVNNVMQEMNWDEFTVVLPSLRKAFLRFNPFEKNIFTEKLAQMLGIRKLSAVKGPIEISDLVKVFLQEIDNEVEQIFKEWEHAK